MNHKRITQNTLRTFIWSALLALGMLLGASSAKAASLAFNFTLPSGATTSAGAYKPDGTLVKTLWRKVYYGSGSYSYTWDGKDDNGTDVAAGDYQFKIVAHNMQYVWDGAIGNTSTSQTGPSVHKAFYPMHDMAIAGTNAFYVCGYNEANFSFARFSTSAPQVVTKRWRWFMDSRDNGVANVSSNIWDRSWKFTATDGTRAYFAAPIGTDPVTRAETHAGFITASNVSDSSSAPFSAGAPIPEGGDAHAYIPNGIYAGTQPGVSGLAVQTSGNFLAAAVRPDNKIYFFDKTSGAAEGSLAVTEPGRIEFAPNGDLWVTMGTAVVRYTFDSNSSQWTAVTTITGFSNPLDVAVHPSDNEIVMVADGGASQQIKAYNSTGASLWTYGTAGGYATNITVANNKFWFSPVTEHLAEDTFIAIQSDGSFWVGDGGNNRNLHFSSSRTYIAQIAFVPHSYTVSVDRNATTRVFNEFMEYSVNYGQAVGSSWTLVKNWGAGLPAGYFTPFGRGLKQTVTLSNGRTYSTAFDAGQNKQMLLELVGTKARIIGPLDSAGVTTINPNGDLIKLTPGTPSWTRRALTGFDASNNPIWAADSALASAENGATDPSPRCCSMGEIRAPITSSNVIVSYDQSMNDGFHLGGVNVGGTSWLWRAMPAVPTNVPPDGLGSYDIGDGVTYGGNTAVVSGRHIVAGYHGEFYMGQGQAGQFMHFYDNGLFLGQFGVPSIGYSAADGAIAGFAGNGFSPELVKASNGETYLWVNDEGAHGPQRWHLMGANSIRELSGSGTLGGSVVTINAPASNFPTNLVVTPGNARVGLTWTSVAGATSYKVKYSTTNGGPYTTVSGIIGTNYTKTSLTNGTKYYFAVSAVVGGVESPNSDQTDARPFNPTVVVQTAGRQSSIQSEYIVNSTAPTSGLPALTGLSSMVGDLTLHNVGNKGYRIFNWGGYNSDNTNVLAPFSVTKGSGWINDTYLSGNFKVDGTSSSNSGLYSNPAGTIDISVSDTNFHILTVFSSARFADTRSFTIKLTPQGQATPVASYTVANESPGKNHTFQFLFKGNVTLTMDSTGGAIGTVQAIFLDNMNVLSTPAAPTGLTATAGNAQVVLSWTATPGATSYNVYRGTTSNGQSTTAIATGITGTSYTNTGLTNGTTYYYKIKAVNGAGTSGYSNQASATPVSTPPVVTVPTISNSGFELPSTSGYIYNPTGASWTFAGNSGVQKNGSDWGATNAPEGVQTAFLQTNPTNGVISQAVNFTSTGNFTLSFKAARRSGQEQPIKVSVDGVQIGGLLTPSTNNFEILTSASFTISSVGTHVIKLEATTIDSDYSSFVDDIKLNVAP